MAARYNDTNPIGTMTIKIMIDSNGLLLFYIVRLEISNLMTQNNNINCDSEIYIVVLRSKTRNF